MEDQHDVPLRVIRAFERTTGLHVCFHDLSGLLYAYLPPDRFAHNIPLCMAVKAMREPACVACDASFARTTLLERPDGAVKICHAGLVEWIVAHTRDERIEWVLFAGQRTPGRNLTVAVRDPQSPMRPTPWPRTEALPPPVDDDEALGLLEMTAMLAARLREWQRAFEARPGAPQRRAANRTTPIPAQVARRVEIRRFVQARHRSAVRLQDLAASLHISESRAGHAVREACGASFIELLIEARLATAASLLQHSNLSVLEAAARSGFGDISNFHSTFKKKFGVTPHQYRKTTQAGSIV
ncbi:MAG: helix-turn-helix transcriptional regulator [Planctomycetota bacterium]|nr:helix-turn-helix transcriptional regulator [Planctomycetota bacterium]